MVYRGNQSTLGLICCPYDEQITRLISPVRFPLMLPESHLLFQELVVYLFRLRKVPLGLERLQAVVFPFCAQLLGYQPIILVKKTLCT